MASYEYDPACHSDVPVFAVDEAVQIVIGERAIVSGTIDGVRDARDISVSVASVDVVCDCHPAQRSQLVLRNPIAVVVSRRLCGAVSVRQRCERSEHVIYVTSIRSHNFRALASPITQIASTTPIKHATAIIARASFGERYATQSISTYTN